MNSVRLCNSADHRFPVHFPFHEFCFNGTEHLTNEDRNVVFTRDLPLYPSFETAINKYLETRNAYPNGNGAVFCLAPDYRGRIGKISLSTRGLEAEIHSLKSTESEDVLVKVHFELPEGGSKTGDVDIEDGVARFPANDFPTKAFVILVSRDTAELIDETQYSGQWAYQDPRTTIESTQSDIENLALAGESQSLEYKEAFTSATDIAKAVVSFANTHGGQVLVGVTDEGQIVGVKMKKIHDHVEQILRSHCDPPLQAKVEVVNVSGRQVASIRVAPGVDKPYSVRDHGIYIRSGATSRIATRYELDQLMAAKNEPLRGR